MPEPDIYRVANEFRAALLNFERAAAVEMVRQYGAIWRRLKGQLDYLQRQMAEARAAGEDVRPSWLFRKARLESLQQQAILELSRFAQDASLSITRQQQRAVEAAQEHAERLALASMGEPPPGVLVRWDRLPKEALTDLVGFTQNGSPLRGLLDELGPDVSAGMRRALITGLATGRGPRDTARLVRQRFGMGLARALTISRTETLRAYRESSRRSYEANSDVVKGWIWHSALGRRTCAACYAMHGSKHKNSERLDDHPNGRCAMLPETVTWEGLGKQIGVDFSGIPDTRPRVEAGEDIFKRLPEAQKLEVLGPAKYAAYKDGAITLQDLVGQKRDRRWGTMRYERSLSDILGADEAWGWRQAVLAGQLYEGAGQPSEGAHSARLARELARVEREMREANSSREIAYVYRPSGELIIAKTGGELGIMFSRDEAEALAGAVVTHWHSPGGYRGLSRDDMGFAMTNALAEVRAVDPDFVYSLKRGDQGWNARYWSEIVHPARGELAREVNILWQDRLARGDVTMERYQRDALHELTNRLARRLGLQYERR